MAVRIAGLYLGAGAGSRMGCPKLSIEMPDGRKLGAWALEEAMRSDIDVLHIVGRSQERADWLPDAYDLAEREGRCRYIRCEDADGGMSHSIRCGMRAVEQQSFDAVIVLLADQPLVRAQMINDLADAFRRDPALHYVASGCNGKAMPPALFSKRMFPRLMQLEGDAGARAVFSSPQYTGCVIEQNADNLADADTPEDVARIIGWMEKI